MAEKIVQVFLKTKPLVRKVYANLAAALGFIKKEVLDDPYCYESTLERP